MRRILCLILLGFCFMASAFAQSSSSLEGNVLDPTGAAIPDAQVTLTNKATGATRVGKADKRGHYQFEQVMPGPYMVMADATGFGQISADNVQLLVNTPATINLTYQSVGAGNLTVEVSSTAAQVNTQDATLGNVIGERPVVQLPLEGRNVTGLLALQPGVTFIKEPNPGSPNDYRSGSVNGGKADQANVLLDGIDANDQQNRTSFTSVMRVTLDSTQEFRTITANPGAELGHSSGAQVTLVTKAGTNTIHGSVYEYHRDSSTEANSYLSKEAGQPRVALVRNIFGASIGGPIEKDRLFLFMNYEGRRDASGTAFSRIVPTANFRQGIFSYENTSKGTSTLTPAQVNSYDPQGIGEDQAALATFQQYPLPNLAGGDGYNTSGYVFNAATPLTYNTYIARLDYNIDRAGKHSIFVRGNMQADNYHNGPPQFPTLPSATQPSVSVTQPSSSVYENFTKGFGFGYNWVVSPRLVNSARFGLTRESTGTFGTQTAPTSYFDAITPIYAMGTASSTSAGGTTTAQQLPVWDIRDDVTWSKGHHTIGFGGEIFLLHNHYQTNSASFSNAYADGLYLVNDGSQFLAPDAIKNTAYELQFSNLLGLLAKLQRRTNYDLNGDILPEGTMIKRVFFERHFDLYLQDAWKVTPNFTVTGGVRYTMSPPIYETNGYNVVSTENLGQFFANRATLAASGQSQAQAGSVTYDLASKLGRTLYNFQNDVAPRISFAYSPSAADGFWKTFTGGPGNFSIRGGWGLFYDAFGEGLETQYSNAVGFSTLTQNGSGQQIANVPRYTGFYDVPFNAPLFPASPAGGFPQTASTSNPAQASTVDSGIRSPYSMVENLTLERQLPGNFLVQLSYVGRQSRRSLTGEDLAAPTNLVDPASGRSYYQAAAAMANAVHTHIGPNGKPLTNIALPSDPYWENLWPGAAGGGLTATEAIYNQFAANEDDWTSALLNIDTACTPSCSRLGKNTMFNAQYLSLYAFRSIGMGQYDALQVLVRKAYSHGWQFDFNYTLSKCLDLGSTPESSSATTGTGSILNSFAPSQMHAVCDYDLRHQISTFGIVELPFGKGKMFGNHVNRVVDELIGGWQLTSLVRETSGFPGSVTNGVGYPTVWDFTGYATLTGKVPTRGPKGQLYANPTTAAANFSATFAGQSGSRNVLRGDGVYTWDAGLDKRFHLFSLFDHPHTLQIRAEVFNLTNTARFDIQQASLSFASPATFGTYTGGSASQLVDPRVMQFAARYEW